MSIESEILRIQHNIANAYAAVADKGGEIPLQPTSENLAAAVASIPTGVIPAGTIVMWSGGVDNIPTGWVLCNGENDTPDLRNRFVLGAGGTYNVGVTGGEETHYLTYSELPGDNPSFSTDIRVLREYSSTPQGGAIHLQYTDYGRYETAIPDYSYSGPLGYGQPHNNMPPYYALCYIMKL